MIDSMNHYGKNGIPFLFIIDFEMHYPVVIPLHKVNQGEILFDIKGINNCHTVETAKKETLDYFYRKPVDYSTYREAFNIIHRNQKDGNSYLANLTFETVINTNLTLKELFFLSVAPYRLWYKDQFTVFSPETFVTIENGYIYSFPMKGTIDAAVPDAQQVIMADEKEFSEHLTIVDLIRNDLGRVATDITVEKFRYLDSIRTNRNTLLQVSSAVRGTLNANYRENIGTIVHALLPAGSICGAPKKKTVEIIREAEKKNRGYYTGVFGYFDGSTMDSCVMIRYIETNGDTMVYRSGGGITYYSDPRREYQEMMDKVYVPIN
ncbi:MAG TPA: aminodeoxychorismate synthase component I [Spirochaetota bacterium]|nr:aminodeoxychorismate synthase component I [Spirochaetota bacterium]